MLCLLGSARVNAGVLQRHSSSEDNNSSSGPRRIVVGATYSKDGWETRCERVSKDGLEIIHMAHEHELLVKYFVCPMSVSRQEANAMLVRSRRPEGLEGIRIANISSYYHSPCILFF